MLIRGTKGYFKEKIEKNNFLSSAYKFINNLYGNYYKTDSKFIFKNGILYSLSKKIEYKSKSEIINLFGLSFFNNLKKRIIKGNFLETNDINLSKFFKNQNEIDKVFYDNLSFFYKKGKLKFLINGNNYYFGINDIFKSLDDFKEYINFIKNKFKVQTEYFILFGILGNKIFNEYKGESNLLIKLLKENKLETNNNYYYNEVTFEINKEVLLNNIENFIQFKIKTEEYKLDCKFNKKEITFLKKNGVIDNSIKENQIYSFSELLKLINKKGKKWNKIDKYYTTAPKWYRKIKNKKLKNKNKQILIKGLKNNNFNIIDNIKYVKNASRYY